jgi:hypothetical protein
MIYLIDLPDPPEGYRYKIKSICHHFPYEGHKVIEFRRADPGEYLFDSCNIAVLSKFGTSGEFLILEKIEPPKPSYTEAVKATGWKWPLCARWSHIAYDSMGYPKGFSEEPTAVSGSWRTIPSQLDLTHLEEHLLPTRFTNDYDWTETLLYRENFE